MRRFPRQYLFITGTARSGTTTFADFIRHDRQIIMGRERYAWRLRTPGAFTRSLFERRRFCLEYRRDDSHQVKHQPYYGEANEYFEDAAFVGDKLPALALDYRPLDGEFDGCKVIYMLREPYGVATSYQRRAERSRELIAKGEPAERKWPVDRGWEVAVDEWNLSMRNTLERLAHHPVFVLDYDRLYRDLGVLQALYDFLELPLDELLAAVWLEQGRERSEIEAKRDSDEPVAAIGPGIRARADFQAYRALLALAP